MKPITEYQDYRRYMHDFYEEQKKSGFTWREFSKDAGFASPSYLKLVCEGKSSLSRVGLPRVADAMKLSGFERTYFEKMVEFGNATNDEKRKAAFKELTRIAKEQKARVIDADTFAYYESAINSIVRELAPLMPGALPNEIAKRIRHLYTALHRTARRKRALHAANRNKVALRVVISKTNVINAIEKIDNVLIITLRNL